MTATGVAHRPASGAAGRAAGLLRQRTSAAWLRLQRLTIWQWGLVALVAGYTTYMTRVTLDVHHGLGTSAYDYGLYDQGVWLLSRFEAPFVTLMGRNLFGDHTSFILLPLVPVYWVFPGAGTLFFSQAFAIGLGAVPVFLLARKLLVHESLALAMAAGYLLHPAVGWTNRENFHPDSFIAVLVGFAIYAAVERRWRMYAVFFIAALMVKEDASLVLVPLGVWVGVKRDKLLGVASVLGALSFMLFAMFVVMKNLIGVPTRNTWRIPFGGPTGFLKAVVTRPWDVVAHYWSDSRPFYFWQMTFPFLFVFALAPSVALISLVVLLTNMLSTFWYQYQIEYHYALVAVPALSMGTVWAIAKLPALRQWLVVGAVTLAAVWTAWAWGPLPFSRNEIYTWAPDHPVAVAARDIIDDIPGGAVVSAQHSLTAHLAHRTEIFMFPTPFSAELYGPDDSLAYQRLPAADRVDVVVLQNTMEPEDQAVWDRVKDDFVLVEQNEWWSRYERAP